MKRSVLFMIGLSLLLLSQEVEAEVWERVHFAKPYNGQTTMTLLIEWSVGEYEMELMGECWTVTLELPKGRYNYTFSDSKSSWHPDWPSQNRNNPVVYVGYQRADSDNFSVYHSGIDSEHLAAVMRVLESAYRGLKGLYGIDLRERLGRSRIEVMVDVAPGNSNYFSELGYIRIITTPEILARPQGKRNIYGLCHELAHLAIGFRDRTLSEAFAHAVGSYLVTHQIWPELGMSAWPEAYDYLPSEGEEWAKKWTHPTINAEFAHFLCLLHEGRGPAFVGGIVKKLPCKDSSEDAFRLLAEKDGS